jgi:hypothetical protein
MSSPTNSAVGGGGASGVSSTTTAADGATMNAQDEGPLIHSPVDDHPAQDLDAELVARDF